MTNNRNTDRTKNLRGRIAAVKVFEDGQNTGAATFYDYDIHGNVEKLVQSLPELAPKTVEYSYDLLSGNVHRVTYQKGQTDQFMHRYAQHLFFCLAIGTLRRTVVVIAALKTTPNTCFFLFGYGTLRRTEEKNSLILYIFNLFIINIFSCIFIFIKF